MRDRHRVEIEQAVLRLKALEFERQAAWFRVGAAAARTTAALMGLNHALREVRDAEETARLFAHPDVMDLDLADAAWNPQQR